MKTTWILGAGASISNSNCSYPSIDTIFSKAKKYGIISETTKRIKKEYEDLHKYIKNNFGKNILRQDEKIDIEELLTFLEISKSKFETSESIVLYEKTINLIQTLFNNINLKVNSNTEYDILAKQLNPSDTVITFNWDLMLDNTFGRHEIFKDRHKKSINKQYSNFIEDFSSIDAFSWVSSGIPEPYLKYESKEGYYLKLHGSVDWGYCDNKKCRGYGNVIPLKFYQQQYYCGKCHTAFKTLIIPPVLNKQYEQYPLISSIWTAAERELNNTNELILWGYSLPPTDFYANWLLHQTNKLNKVVVINPDVKRGSEKITYNSNFLKRLLKPVGYKSNKIELYEFFSDYISNINIAKKYKIDNNFILYSNKRGK